MHVFLSRLARSLLLLSLVLAPAAGLSSASARDLTEADKARPIIIASDPWCPYACDPDADGRDGYMVDLTREIFEAAGFKVEYRVVNFAMMRRMAKDGTATALPGVASNMDGSVVLPALAQGNSANAVALAHGQEFTFKQPKDFERFRLGVIKDYDYGGAIQEYVGQNMQNPDRIQVLSGFGYSHLVQGLRLRDNGRLVTIMRQYGLEELAALVSN